LETRKATRILQELMSFITILENRTTNTVKNVLSDNVKEFQTEIVHTTLQERGIIKKVTVPYSPQSKGMAERLK
jgi:transposase InsO family protein